MPGTGLPIYSAGLDGAPVSFHFSSSGLARFFYDPNRFGLFLFTRGIGSAEPLPRARTNTCLCKGRGPQDPKKKTQPTNHITHKQPGITQGFPALFSQLAFFKASFWETPCRGRGSLYIARGWMVHPFLFIFPLRGLPGARPQEDLQRRRPKADPKQTNQPKAAWNHPRLSGSILSTCLL